MITERVGVEAMADDSKLAGLLYDPEARTIIFGLAHSRLTSSTDSGPARLREAVIRLGDFVDPKQYQSWLSDRETNSAITVEQVQATFGNEVINDISQYAGISPDAATWQVAAVLPALVDAITPDGKLLEAELIGQQLQAATAADDNETGSFGE